MASEKKVPFIKCARFIAGAPIGLSFIVTNAISQGDTIEGKPVKITFDSDPRFLRVETGGDCVDLVPLANVASIRMKLE